VFTLDTRLDNAIEIETIDAPRKRAIFLATNLWCVALFSLSAALGKCFSLW